MNQPAAAGWSPMVAGPDEEFANFLEFDDLQLGFDSLDGLDQNNAKPPENGDMAVDIPLDTGMDPSMSIFGFDESQVQHLPQASQDQMPAPGTIEQSAHIDFYSMPGTRNMSAQHYSQPHQPHPHVQVKHREYYGRNVIPPTPKSMEMGGGQVQYYPSPSIYPEQAYEQFRRRQRGSVSVLQFDPQLDTDKPIGRFHALGLTGRNASRHAIPPCRASCSRRELQSFDVTRSGWPTLFCSEVECDAELRHLRHHLTY